MAEYANGSTLYILQFASYEPDDDNDKTRAVLAAELRGAKRTF